MNNKQLIIVLSFVTMMIIVLVAGYVAIHSSPASRYSGSPYTVGGIEQPMTYYAKNPVDTNPGEVNPGNIIIPNDKMMVKNYNIIIENDDVDKTINNIMSEVNTLGGKVESVNYNLGQDVDEGVIIVKIPVDRDSDFINYLKEYKIVGYSENAYDVSKQVMGLEEQIELVKKKIELYENYINNTKLNPDVASRYYDKLFSLKAQLQFLEKEKANLENKTLYSTYHITVRNYNEYHVGKITVNFKEVWYNVKKAWATLVVWLIYFITIVLPIIIIAWLGFRYWTKKHV